jgi:hypothetical protein
MALCSASFVLLGALASIANANVFLGRLPHQNATASLSAESEHALLAELEVALGSGHRHATEKRLKRLEQMISPMFAAVSKNENGKLGSAGAGYVLHRVFVQRHGWFIRALEPAGNALAAWNSSNPASILEERVPKHVQDLFENRLGDHGLGIKELAILAATLEHLVHTEALDRLKVAYMAKSLSQEDVLSEDEAVGVLDMYMSLYILGFLHSDLSTLSATKAQELHANINELYPTWPETQQFLREVHRSVAPKRDYLYFNEVENVIAEIGERYGRFQDIECRQFKDWLVAIEDPSVGGAGRVRISDFYGQALNNGKWQFSESIDYLRQLGALDESDPSNPRVIIPNYISGPSNCVASSSYYSVCCLDECEGILGRVEQLIAAPEAPASTILSAVPMISSATMPSNRTLSPWLHHRLEEIAQHHGGLVPLHGRLFAQWLHYAYPRECTFPHVAGTIDPQRPEDLIIAGHATESEISANETVMKQVVAEAAPVKRRVPGVEALAHEESAMWSMHEELVVWRPADKPVGAWWFSTHSMNSVSGRAFAMLGAVLSLSVALVRSLEPALRNVQKGSSEKYYV